MNTGISRRGFLKMASVAGTGGIITVSGFAGVAPEASAAEAPKQDGGDFCFIQLSDTHWGFDKAEINPDAKGTLPKALERINALPQQPDFVVFTGDLTHTTDDDKERRARMTGFREVIKALRVKEVKFLAGEHDASLDAGAAFKEFFGETHYSFDHKGVHFIALDNVSDPSGVLGEAQLQWLSDDLKKHDPGTRIVVLTHRPLFDLAPQWDWATHDGARALDLLMPYKNTAVLYGHIHQENHHMTGPIGHHSAMGMMYPLPAPMSAPKKAPIPWDPDHPHKGLGYRQVDAKAAGPEYALTEMHLADTGKVAASGGPEIIKITAKKFEYSPSNIALKKGVPVILEFTSLDRKHGFNCPDLNLRATIEPDKTSQVAVTPDKTGTFEFHCDVFCGSGHEQMTGTITVTG